MNALRLAAPAKLNLFLHVVGRRPDGYHRLQSLFQLIDLCDDITLTPRDDGQVLRCGGVPGLAAEDDLTVRAAHALRSATGTRGGVTIEVRKRIPAGAGLGGGSSDAAAVLLGLNAVWRLGLSDHELADLGATLGADVPVFVHGRSAWVQGIGEQVEPVHLAPAWFAVCVPDVHVDTATVFRAADLVRDTPETTRELATGDGTVPAIVRRGRNDCAAVSRRLHPAVDALLAALDGHAARLSGTGGAVFVACDSADEARRVVGDAPASAHSFVCRGLNQSPVRDAISRAAG